MGINRLPGTDEGGFDDFVRSMGLEDILRYNVCLMMSLRPEGMQHQLDKGTLDNYSDSKGRLFNLVPYIFDPSSGEIYTFDRDTSLPPFKKGQFFVYETNDPFPYCAMGSNDFSNLSFDTRVALELSRREYNRLAFSGNPSDFLD